MSTNIKKTWFYIIDKTFWDEIYIEKDLYISLFAQNISNDIIINIGENSKVDFYWFFYNICPKNITINQYNNNSSLSFKSLFIDNTHDLISNITSQIDSENSSAYLNIIGIVKENNISIDSNIKITNTSKKIEAKLDLENIFIGKNGSIVSLPNLFIDTNDVKVSHSSKSHRLDTSKLFYLQSRGLDETNTIALILQSYFIRNFSCLYMMDREMYTKSLNNFLKIIEINNR